MRKKNVDFSKQTIDFQKGLTAAQVEERVKAGYDNANETKVEKSYLQIILSNVFTFFSILLFAIAIVFVIVRHYLIVIGHPELAAAYFGASKYIYLLPLVLNIIIGTIQEIRSKHALEKLKIVADAKYKVLRDGQIIEVDSKDIVIDDILILKEGEQVPADGTLIQGCVQVDESLLTGESDNVEKVVDSKLLSGSFVISGGCQIRVSHVGVDTYANQLQKKVKKMSKNKSDLMKNIYGLINIISVLLVVITIIIFFVMSAKIREWGADPNLFISQATQNFMTKNFPGVSLPTSIAPYDPYSISIIVTTMAAYMVGMIPTGLVLMTSVTLAVSIVRLGKEKTLIQQLYSLESLSGVDVICLDKTGTLTTGEMSVVSYHLAPEYKEEEFKDLMSKFLGAFQARNATAKALIEYFGTKDGEIESYEPFTSATKRTKVTFKDGTAIELGASDFILPGPSQFQNIMDEKVEEGYRLLSLVINGKEAALFVIKDEIRASAKDTITYFGENYVGVKIISGDNPLTVSRIAKQCGVPNSDKYISLAGVRLEEIDFLIDEYTIFGRVSPEQKERIVSALQKKKHKVAMTGDGVNDILALRKADCSISFGKATSAAKNCSDVVLLDNDFSHLKSVVDQGRRVVNNIRRTSVLFLTKTLAVFLLAIFTSFFQRGQSQFTLENLYLVQNSVITVGGFLLSMEGNPHPIKGTFRSKVYPEVLASGIIVFLGALIPFVFSTERFNFIPGDNARTLISMMTTAAGFIVLFRMCYPFSKYRRIVFFVTLAFATLLACALPLMVLGGRPFSLVDIQKNGWDSDIAKNIFFIRANDVFKDFTWKEWAIWLGYIPVAAGLYVLLRFIAWKTFKNVSSWKKRRLKQSLVFELFSDLNK